MHIVEHIQVTDNMMQYSGLDLSEQAVIDLTLEKMSSVDSHKSTFKKHGVSHVHILVSNFRQTVKFTEPQSMNYDVKVNQAVDIFLSLERDDKYLTSISPENPKWERALQIDDQLYSVPKASLATQKKLNDDNFMRRLLKQCEAYVLENADEFEPK